jgi:quinoprotein glucose dehydrogenase
LIRTLRISAMLGMTVGFSVLMHLYPASAQRPDPATAPLFHDWRSYGATNAGTKYSPLDQINRESAKNLRIAWRQSVTPVELRALLPNAPVPVGAGTENTPLMVDGLLYISTGAGTVAALDATTGKVVWFDLPPERGGRRAIGTAGRGVAYWTDGKDARVIGITGGYLVALNAKTGRRYPDFGEGGEITLEKGYDRPSGRYSGRSAPIVVGDVIVVAGMGGPGGDSYEESGPWTKEGWPADVRGFDVRTGKKLWNFHTIPNAGEYGIDTWLEDSWQYTGDANSWGPLAADDELGYVYFGTGSPTGDYWGGFRPGANLFSDSLICLDARTGRRVWHFQTVHHDLWDYDLAPNPVLLDITVNGRKIKAVAQVSKQSFTYVFDRVTGEPVWPIVERPVPKGDVPREWYSPTQPFPTKPPAYDHQGVKIEDLADFTPELRQESIKIISQYRYGPIFTPPSVLNGPDGKEGTISEPGTISTVWNGAGADPETGILYVPSAQTGTRVALVKPKNPRANLLFVRRDIEFLPGPQGLPTPFKPPYGRLVAIDLNKGEILWSAANGNGPRDHPALRNLNLPPLGQGGRAAPMITKTMVFLGEGSNISPSVHIPGSGGKMFRGYDKRTGEVLWEMELPGGTTGAPMTYMVNNKQYIAVTIGWKDMPAEVIALALPQ